MALDRAQFLIERVEAFATVERINLDVFGFSRGAAAARLFANMVASGDLPPVTKLRFLGLFDTVPGMVNAAAPAHRGFHGGLNMNVGPHTADHVVHLTAAHELRANFRLASVRPGPGIEIALPGSHGDIGGSTWDHATTYEGTYADRERLAAEGRLSPEVDTSHVVERRTYETGFDPETDNPGREWDLSSDVPLSLPILPGLSKLSLHIMHRHADGADVPLHALPADQRPPAALTSRLGSRIDPGDPIFRPYVNPSAYPWDLVSHPEDDLRRDVDANFPSLASPGAPPN